MAENMSDADLRKELISLGEKKLGPITDSTRSLYVKKLNRLRAEKKSKNFSESRRSGRKPLAGLSSDESDEETAVKTRGSSRANNKGRRQTRTSSRATTSNKDKTDESQTSTRPNLRSKNSWDSQKTLEKTKPVSYDETGHGSADTVIRSSSSLHNRKSASTYRPSYAFEDTLDLKPRDVYVGSTFRSEFSDTDEEEEGLDFTQTNHDGSEDEEPEMVSHSVNTSANLDRSALWNTSSRNNSGYLFKRNTNNRSPWESNAKTVTKLSSRYNFSPERYYDQAGVMGTDGYKAKESTASHKLPHYISMFLVILALIFFIILTFMYINMHQSHDGDSQDINTRICGSKGDVECNKEEVNEALKYASHILNQLRQRAGQFECGHPVEGRSLQLKDLKSQLKAKFKEAYSEDRETLALQLIVNNPSWEISLFNKDKAEVSQVNEVYILESKIADMNIVCRLMRAVRHVLNTFVYLCIGALLLTLLVAVVKYRWNKKKAEDREVYELVEKVIDILKEHHEQCQEDKDLHDFIAIPHVRDMLIPFKQRSQKQHLWERAVKFLAANESRVRVETQKVRGEEFAVWRWIQAGATANGSKVWQGQAFESNVPNFQPLPCLKVRNMFNADMEKSGDWHVKVQDAIIEKCGPNHEIVHMAVDKTSKEGCVYVKCNTRDAAGKCFSALHGWWFDGKLVTVKFLRSERYYERFPESMGCFRPLTPSDNRKASLSQPFHRSFLEEY